MTKFTEDLVRVVDFGIVVSVWRVWYIADMFMSPADEPRYAKNSFALAAGLVSQCSSNSSFTWVYVGAPRWSSKNLLRRSNMLEGGIRGRALLVVEVM